MQTIEQLAVNAIILFCVCLFLVTCPKATKAIKEDYDNENE